MTFLDSSTFDDAHEINEDLASMIEASDLACFTPLEWQVIALAERDGLSSVAVPGRLSLALGSLFGGHQAGRLADARLEALRRMAVLLWHVREPSPRERGAFLAAGLSNAHAALLQRSIDRRAKARNNSVSRMPATGFWHAQRLAF